jgi:hypothetical protein
LPDHPSQRKDLTMPSKHNSMTEGGAYVLARLVEAVITNAAIPGRVGPKGFGSCMPDYLHSWAETFAMQCHDLYYNEGRHYAAEEKARNSKLAVSVNATGPRIARADEAERWIIDHVSNVQRRKAIWLYAQCKASGRSWGEALTRRNRHDRKEVPWVKQTVLRWINEELEIVFRKLDKTAISLPDMADCQVLQITAKRSGKSIRSKLRVHREERWMPAPTTADENPGGKISNRA